MCCYARLSLTSRTIFSPPTEAVVDLHVELQPATSSATLSGDTFSSRYDDDGGMKAGNDLRVVEAMNDTEIRSCQSESRLQWHGRKRKTSGAKGLTSGNAALEPCETEPTLHYQAPSVPGPSWVQ
jgi:hypothetical protein